MREEEGGGGVVPIRAIVIHLHILALQGGS